ncbi:hypothetical protein T07_5356, partial [Trichinella nelsoni]
LSNKWLLKLPCVYLNAQEIRPPGTIGKRNPSVSGVKIIPFFSQGYSLCCFCDFRKSFWKVLRHINAYLSNKWLLKLPCVYLNAQEIRPPGTIGKVNKRRASREV